MRFGLWSFLLLAVSMANPVEAQFDECPADLDLLRCMTAQLDASRQEIIDARAELVDGEPLKQKVLATPSVATNTGQASALADLLPQFLASVGLDGTTDDTGNYSFEKPILFGENVPLRLSVGATAILEPTIFAPLETSLGEELPEDDRGPRKEELEGKLDELDDFDFKMRLSFEGRIGHRLIGRNYRDYNELFVRAFGGIVEAAQTSGIEATTQLMGLAPELLTRPLREIRGSQYEDEAKTLFDAALAETMALRDAIDVLEAGSYDRLGDLISNQPQLIFSGEYKERNDLSGPDEWKLSASYEIGFGGNVNDLLTWSSNHQTDGCVVTEVDRETSVSYPCLTSYFGGRPEAGEKGNRLAISIEYSDADSFELELPDDDFTFSLERTQKWIGSATYGRQLAGVQLRQPGEGGEENSRFDWEVKYEDVTGDPMRQSRLVSTATISQKITKCTVLSVGAVWAEKPEYRGEVDQEVSARFGFRWGKSDLDGCKGAG